MATSRTAPARQTRKPIRKAHRASENGSRRRVIEVHADQPHHDIDASPDRSGDVRGGASRRRLLSTSGFALLGIGTAARANRAGGQPGSTAVQSPQAPSLDTDSGSGTPQGNSPPIEVGQAARHHGAAPQYYIDDADPRAIALTLDDGPHPVYTPQVLEILDRYGIRATFNMI
ncbi:MAG TPA: polysaccharide deacetylase family protein, partial [Actinospica sp.]|nr:polysaccharide deacetylase family protein [Actinospica sp.]